MTVDPSHGIITGVDCYPANQRESDIIRLKGQPCEYQEIGLDGGYDAVQKNTKNVRCLRHVPQAWEQSGSMPVHIIQLFTGITRK